MDCASAEKISKTKMEFPWCIFVTIRNFEISPKGSEKQENNLLLRLNKISAHHVSLDKSQRLTGSTQFGLTSLARYLNNYYLHHSHSHRNLLPNCIDNTRLRRSVLVAER